MDCSGEHNPSSTSPPHTGTTIVAVTYAGGVVIGADSRVSTGNYISNRASDKITPLTDRVYLLRSGSASDTQAVSDYVRYFTEQHESQLQRPALVKTVAGMIRSMNYQYKHLVGAMIVAGWDAAGGPQVYGCPIGGTLSKESWTTDGSGSTYIWGYLDEEFREGMTRSEAEDLVATALELAMARDGSSGGVVRLVTITEKGAERRLIKPEEHPVLWDELPTPLGVVV
ncbi:Proteasome subunit beta type-6 [Auxenochlorella protothecoides]|uniref:Proteasome subunit beta n=1 Tax=Auxenochlorella protothecoides TaxID=3075 RepID=A0A087SHC2_AUXPR|nr:Proteasome subunit beta type-6 [Auxenochlorella protothecoides]KFM25126.1 Proteasome subunit beta type-6 [Auxenochlorella protothecoides]